MIHTGRSYRVKLEGIAHLVKVRQGWETVVSVSMLQEAENVEMSRRKLHTSCESGWAKRQAAAAIAGSRLQPVA